MIELAILAAGALLLWVGWWLPKHSASGRAAAWLDEQRAAGLTAGQGVEEMFFRTAYARLRREASDECIAANGALAPDRIKEMVADACDRFAMAHPKDRAKRFAAWAGTLKDREILYPDAWKLYVAYCRYELSIYHDPGLADENTLADIEAAKRIIRN